MGLLDSIKNAINSNAFSDENEYDEEPKVKRDCFEVLEEELPKAYELICDGKYQEAYDYAVSGEAYDIATEVLKDVNLDCLGWDIETGAEHQIKFYQNTVIAYFLYNNSLCSDFSDFVKGDDYIASTLKNTFRKIIEEFESFEEVPILDVEDGLIDLDDKSIRNYLYNPFVNFLKNCNLHALTGDDLEAIYDLYSENIIGPAELLGLDDEKILYDPELYTSTSARAIVATIKRKKGIRERKTLTPINKY